MIIGIIGKLESGKTTLANFIKEIEPNTKLVAFADYLKKMLYESGLCTKEELWVKKTKNSRLLMQKVGTDIIRKQINDNFFINKARDEINNIRINYIRGTNIIFHDTRFINEVNLIKSYEGGIIIKITRPENKNIFKKFLNILSTKKKNFKKHQSEIEMDSIVPDYEIINDGTIEELKISAFKLLKEIEKRDTR